MRYLGIDYGSKRVGIALSDVEGQMAFPKAVLPNNRYLIMDIVKLCKSQKVEVIVVGESKDFNMNDNPILASSRFFAQELGRETGCQVEFEPEYMTSAQAERIQGKGALLDASAAAIILQSYLDKQVHKNSGSK
jgi:putative holliday junction resolvase